jgi:anti-anti-sigma factor
MGGSAARRHGCLGYADEDTLVRHGLHFLLDCASRGRRLVIVGMLGSWSERLQWALRGQLDLRPDQLVVVEATDVYPVGQPIDAETQLVAYDGMIEQALADGYTGLGVVAAEMAPMLAPELLESHLAWETTVDHYMTDHPLEGMCCFPTEGVPDHILVEVIGAHSLGCPEHSWLPRVYALPEGAVGVAGELDAFAAPRVRRMLDRVAPETGDLVVDLEDVTFVDHTAVVALAGFAEERRAAGATVTVANPPRLVPLIERLCGVSL